MNDVAKKLPPALKRLAERRARLAADVQRLAALQSEVNERLFQARRTLYFMDHAIELLYPAVDPDCIEPIRATKNKYGKHGGLSEAIASILETGGQGGLTCPDVVVFLAARFELPEIAIPVERNRFNDNVRRRMNKMKRLVKLEQVPDSGAERGALPRWRLVQQVASDRTSHAERAEAMGLSIVEAEDEQTQAE